MIKTDLVVKHKQILQTYLKQQIQKLKSGVSRTLISFIWINTPKIF